MGYYSNKVLATLILIILTAAARVITVKVYFQLGYDDAFLGSILVLLGQSLALPIYYGVKWLALDTDEGIDEGKSDVETGGGAKTEDATSDHDTDLEDVVTGELATASVQERPLPTLGRMLVHTEWRSDSDLFATCEDEPEQDGDASRSTNNVEPIGPSTAEKESPAQVEEEETNRVLCHIGSGRGSFIGLTQQSQDAVQWVHKIPGWAKLPR